MSPMTIEGYIVKLYETGDLRLKDILEITKLENIKQVKKIIESEFLGSANKLKLIKDKLEELGFKKISYFDIKICIAMIKKDDN